MLGKVRYLGNDGIYFVNGEVYELVGIEESLLRVYTTECEDDGNSYLMSPGAFEPVSLVDGVTWPDVPALMKEHPERFRAFY